MAAFEVGVAPRLGSVARLGVGQPEVGQRPLATVGAAEFVPVEIVAEPEAGASRVVIVEQRDFVPLPNFPGTPFALARTSLCNFCRIQRCGRCTELDFGRKSQCS